MTASAHLVDGARLISGLCVVQLHGGGLAGS